jgi:hypothetical protein
VVFRSAISKISWIIFCSSAVIRITHPPKYVPGYALK